MFALGSDGSMNDTQEHVFSHLFRLLYADEALFQFLAMESILLPGEGLYCNYPSGSNSSTNMPSLHYVLAMPCDSVVGPICSLRDE